MDGTTRKYKSSPELQEFLEFRDALCLFLNSQTREEIKELLEFLDFGSSLKDK